MTEIASFPVPQLLDHLPTLNSCAYTYRDLLVIDEGDSRMCKTSVCFSLGEGPGQLFKAFSVFALRDIDMTKIESRPMRTNPLVTLKVCSFMKTGAWDELES